MSTPSVLLTDRNLLMQGGAAVVKRESCGRAALAGGACHCRPLAGGAANVRHPVQRGWRGALGGGGPLSDAPML